jgi:type I restriction enzyme S subunit
MTSRATIGAFALAQRPTAVNQGFIVVNAHDATLQMWLFHEMRARISEFISHANGATFLELSRGKFKAFTVRVAESQVMADFGVFAEALHEQAAALTAESDRLAATRDALLPLLMSGKVSVKDAESVVGEVL